MSIHKSLLFHEETPIIRYILPNCPTLLSTHNDVYTLKQMSKCSDNDKEWNNTKERQTY